jgi:hypothetical protein
LELALDAAKDESAVPDQGTQQSTQDISLEDLSRPHADLSNLSQLPLFRSRPTAPVARRYKKGA